MADTIEPIKLDTQEWFDVSSITGITAGTPMQLTNRGRDIIMVCESSTPPESNGIGLPLTPIAPGWPSYGVMLTASGASNIYVRSVSGRGLISIQPVD